MKGQTYVHNNGNKRNALVAKTVGADLDIESYIMIQLECEQRGIRQTDLVREVMKIHARQYKQRLFDSDREVNGNQD